MAWHSERDDIVQVKLMLNPLHIDCNRLAIANEVVTSKRTLISCVLGSSNCQVVLPADRQKLTADTLPFDL